MSELYQRIVRVKPIIEADANLCARLCACYDHAYKDTGMLPPDIVPESRTRRTMYMNIGTIIDSEGNETLFPGVKLLQADCIEFNGMYSGEGKKEVCPLLANELGKFDILFTKTYAGFDIPHKIINLIGVVYHPGYDRYGMLMEDLSNCGKREVSQSERTADVTVKDGEETWAVTIDLKFNIEDEDIERGKKYFSEEAMVVLPVADSKEE